VSEGHEAAAEREAVRAVVRLGALRAGFRMVEERRTGSGWWAVLRREEEEVFCFVPLGRPFITVSVSTAVARSLWRDRRERAQQVAADFDVAVIAAPNERSEEEVFVNLSLRVFLPGLAPETVPLAAENLEACRQALNRTIAEEEST
jgi:hypothetical protein